MFHDETECKIPKLQPLKKRVHKVYNNKNKIEKISKPFTQNVKLNLCFRSIGNAILSKCITNDSTEESNTNLPETLLKSQNSLSLNNNKSLTILRETCKNLTKSLKIPQYQTRLSEDFIKNQTKINNICTYESLRQKYHEILNNLQIEQNLNVSPIKLTEINESIKNACNYCEKYDKSEESAQKCLNKSTPTVSESQLKIRQSSPPLNTQQTPDDQPIKMCPTIFSISSGDDDVTNDVLKTNDVTHLKTDIFYKTEQNNHKNVSLFDLSDDLNTDLHLNDSLDFLNFFERSNYNYFEEPSMILNQTTSDTVTDDFPKLKTTPNVTFFPRIQP